MNKKVVEISKFLSYILRHHPEAIGISLDPDGWVEITTLLSAAQSDGKEISHALLLEVVASNDKKRFSISDDGLRIRAAQGHSVGNVEIKYQATTPPELLYHGTATRFIASIMQQGLIPGSRQYVHLSADLGTAKKVGSRHGVPTILQVAASEMQAAGFEFFQADNGVWLCKNVPVEFLTRQD